MHAFGLEEQQEWNPRHHVEKILGSETGGDFTVACWEPGQISPYHCHPDATEIYFCYSGGGTMRTPDLTVSVTPGWFVVHPPGEVHEYENGPQRTLLFRVRYGSDMAARHHVWRNNPEWRQSDEDAAYYKDNPVAGS
jgi:quercetin dioxygenase-like cupin family protein